MFSVAGFQNLLQAGLLLASATVVAQPGIKGSVHDPSANPVPFCNVFVEQNGVIRALSTTDSFGNFILQPLDTGTFRLVVTSIGYKKHIQSIRLENSMRDLAITLYPDTVLLEQIIVHDEGPIRTRGDTVVYDATYFARGDEVVLADLLKKLPGISVSDNGRVKFQGKEVSKIKVDQDDLFDNNYPILTKNLSADLVEQVEVLQNYSDNRLLKNIEDTEDVALNITLRKDRRQQLFGNVSGETNFHDRYDANTNVISFTRKLKIYALASTNNLGMDPTGDVDELLGQGNSAQIPGGDVASSFLVPVTKPYIAQFKRDRYFFNQAMLGSLNGVFRPVKNLRISLHAYQFRDKNNFQVANQTVYYTPSDTVRYDEIATTDNTEQYQKVRTLIEYDPSATLNLRYQGTLMLQDGTTGQQGNLNQVAVVEHLESQTTVSDHLLTLTRKSSVNTAMTLAIHYLSDKRPQRYRVDGNLFKDYFTLASADTLLQESDLPTRYWGGEWNFYRRMPSGKLGIRAGYDRLEQTTESDLSSADALLAYNRVGTIQKKAYAEAYFAWKLGTFVLTPGAALQHLDASVSDRATSPYVFFNPRLGFKWLLSSHSRLSGLYSFNQPTSSAPQLNTRPLLTDYNMMAVNDNGFRTFPTRTLLISYDLGSWGSGFSIFSNLLHKEIDMDYLTNSDIEANYVVATMNQVANRKLTSVNVMLDKYFRSLRTNLKINWSFTRAEFVTSTESVTVPTVSNAHNLDVSLRTALPGAVNAHLGHILQTSATRSGLIDASNYSSLVYLDGYINLYDGRLSFTLHGERFELLSLDERPVFYFIDFNVRYAANAAKSVMLILTGRNLLDERAFAQRFVSSQSVATSVNRLIPRYVLAGMEFRF